eukprot:366092-Chlamydomonas_euryale.AAC.20
MARTWHRRGLAWAEQRGRAGARHARPAGAEKGSGGSGLGHGGRAGGKSVVMAVARGTERLCEQDAQ